MYRIVSYREVSAESKGDYCVSRRTQRS